MITSPTTAASCATAASASTPDPPSTRLSCTRTLGALDGAVAGLAQLVRQTERRFGVLCGQRGATMREFMRFVSDELASLAAGDGAQVHPSHVLESEEERLLSNCWCCKRCCRIVASSIGQVTQRGPAECPGGQRIVLRDDRQYLVPVEARPQLSPEQEERTGSARSSTGTAG